MESGAGFAAGAAKGVERGLAGAANKSGVTGAGFGLSAGPFDAAICFVSIGAGFAAVPACCAAEGIAITVHIANIADHLCITFLRIYFVGPLTVCS
ncbi:MAG: hypothetical protein PVS2B2_15120 [Candidatus Acidiferrum sp.]